MKWIVDNWSLLVVSAAFIMFGYIKLHDLCKLPSEAQQAKIKEWLLYAVIMAEKEFQSGTGRLKLAYVYSLFLDKFKAIAPAVPFEVFSAWVDEVLIQMKQILETNKDIDEYVKGD